MVKRPIADFNVHPWQNGDHFTRPRWSMASLIGLSRSSSHHARIYWIIQVEDPYPILL